MEELISSAGGVEESSSIISSAGPGVEELISSVGGLASSVEELTPVGGVGVEVYVFVTCTNFMCFTLKEQLLYLLFFRSSYF